MTKKIFTQLLMASGCVMGFLQSHAQTDADAIMMYKNNLCSGLVYEHSAWDHYWEGTHKRDNANLGTVRTQMASVMAIYGITGRLNVMANLPYIKNQASAGQLHGMKGLQDLSLWVKWLPLQKEVGNGTFSLFAIGGFMLPASNYTPDFLPLSIGMHSKTAALRGLVDYQFGDWFATASATYNRHSNITLDRHTYYTTEMHYSREVKMPNATQYQVRAGRRSTHVIAEAIVTNYNTLGGFDITKNNMPFPSNEMDMTTAGVNLKYEFGKWLKGVSLIGGGSQTVCGRNVGQSTAFYGGIFYVVNFNKK